MGPKAEDFPFQASEEGLQRNLEKYVESIIRSLHSELMELPKGASFISYEDFSKAYEELKKATDGFSVLDPNRILEVCLRVPLTLIVLRTILGFSPTEWAAAAQRFGVKNEENIRVKENYVRSLEGRIKRKPFQPMTLKPGSRKQILKLIQAACQLIQEGAPDLEDRIHRLDKGDTKHGIISLQNASLMGFPYPMVLYERFLGRPFASHRDAVSEWVGRLIEKPIEELLVQHGISYRKVARAEAIPGFPQAPDFIIPDEFNPRVVIEAKIAEDQGTARDKIARILQLVAASGGRFEVVACIDGRGFARRSELRKLLIGTKGKVFTLDTLKYMIEHTSLRNFVSRNPFK